MNKYPTIRLVTEVVNAPVEGHPWAVRKIGTSLKYAYDLSVDFGCCFPLLSEVAEPVILYFLQELREKGWLPMRRNLLPQCADAYREEGADPKNTVWTWRLSLKEGVDIRCWTCAGCVQFATAVRTCQSTPEQAHVDHPCENWWPHIDWRMRQWLEERRNT